MAREPVSFEDRMARVDAALALVRAEVERAARKHPPFNSRHEGYAVLLEEVDELWEDVKADRYHPAIIEAIQVAAMGVRFITDLGTWEIEEKWLGGSFGHPVEELVLRDGAIIEEEKAAEQQRMIDAIRAATPSIDAVYLDRMKFQTDLDRLARNVGLPREPDAS